jgi:beta-glucanase (GH16 family)
MAPRSTAVALVSALLALPVVECGSAQAGTGTVVTSAFVEEFDGPAGAPPNPDYWSVDVGSSAEHGWEAGSLQTYTDAPENIMLDGEGNLVIRARKAGDGYTSGRMTTRDKIVFPFGTIAARMKLPAGQGLWSAFWMLGANAETVGWPDCGEIDIIELVNDPTQYHVAVHGPEYDAVEEGAIDDLSADFHDYWMTRRENSVTIGVDDTVLATFTPETVAPDSPWVFNDPMFVLIILAVGGTWPGPPDDSTRFPATLLVDWMRFEPLN